MKISFLVSALVCLGSACIAQAKSIIDNGLAFNFYDGLHGSTQKNWQNDPIFGTGWVPIPGGGVQTLDLISSTFFGEYYIPSTVWNTYSELLVSFQVTENVNGTRVDHYFTFDGVTKANLTFPWVDFTINTRNQPSPPDPNSIGFKRSSLYGKPITVPEGGSTLAMMFAGVGGLIMIHRHLKTTGKS